MKLTKAFLLVMLMGSYTFLISANSAQEVEEVEEEPPERQYADFEPIPFTLTTQEVTKGLGEAENGQKREENDTAEVEEQVEEPEEEKSEPQEEPKQQEQPKEEQKPYTEMTVTATAYISFCDSGCSGITATGYDVRDTITTKEGYGIIAVDPNVIPLGSIVEIDGKKYKALDTGGAIKGNRIDILMGIADDTKAYEFGVQKKVIKVFHSE